MSSRSCFFRDLRANCISASLGLGSADIVGDPRDINTEKIREAIPISEDPSFRFVNCNVNQQIVVFWMCEPIIDDRASNTERAGRMWTSNAVRSQCLSISQIGPVMYR
jgi:hypothetical protein